MLKYNRAIEHVLYVQFKNKIKCRYPSILFHLHWKYLNKFYIHTFIKVSNTFCIRVNMVFKHLKSFPYYYFVSC
jgi:hypothetical protein